MLLPPQNTAAFPFAHLPNHIRYIHINKHSPDEVLRVIPARFKLKMTKNGISLEQLAQLPAYHRRKLMESTDNAGQQSVHAENKTIKQDSGKTFQMYDTAMTLFYFAQNPEKQHSPLSTPSSSVGTKRASQEKPDSRKHLRNR